jgi:hypothetical protein
MHDRWKGRRQGRHKMGCQHMWPVRSSVPMGRTSCIARNRRTVGFSAAGTFQVSFHSRRPDPFRSFCWGYPLSSLLFELVWSRMLITTTGAGILPRGTGSTRRESQRASLTKKAGSHHVRWESTAYTACKRSAVKPRTVDCPAGAQAAVWAISPSSMQKGHGHARHCHRRR